MRKAENMLAEKRISIEQKTKLYNEISDNVSTELCATDALLRRADEADDAHFPGIMKYAAVLTAFIKRYSNRILLGTQNAVLPVNELVLALEESLAYLKLYGLKTRGEFSGDAQVDKEMLLFAYRVFEGAVEASLPSASAMLVSLETEKSLVMRMECDSPCGLISCGFEKQAAAMGGMLTYEMADGAAFVTLSLPLGGKE